MCLCGNRVEDNKHFLLHCQRFSIHRTSYLDDVSHLINRSTATLSNSLLCDILLFIDNQFNDITKYAHFRVYCGPLLKKLGDLSIFPRCLMAIRDFADLSFNFASFLLSLDTFSTLPACCCCCLILEIQWLLSNTHSITVVTSWAVNRTRIVPSNFQC